MQVLNLQKNILEKMCLISPRSMKGRLNMIARLKVSLSYKFWIVKGAILNIDNRKTFLECPQAQ